MELKSPLADKRADTRHRSQNNAFVTLALPPGIT